MAAKPEGPYLGDSAKRPTSDEELNKMIQIHLTETKTTILTHIPSHCVWVEATENAERATGNNNTTTERENAAYIKAIKAHDGSDRYVPNIAQVSSTSVFALKTVCPQLTMEVGHATDLPRHRQAQGHADRADGHLRQERDGVQLGHLRREP